MNTKIDHIIYTTPNLEEGMAYIEGLFGERPYFGGQHLGKGSHNALLSLGADVYLEIIAPDPTQPEPAEPRSFGMDTHLEAKLKTWAAATTNMDETVRLAKTAGYDPGERVDGGRLRDDGVQLRWQSTKRSEALTGETPLGDWLIPFLIDWGDTPHPATARPSESTLIALEATHPEPAKIQSLLHALGLSIVVHQGEQIGLTAVIDTKNGRVHLS